MLSTHFCLMKTSIKLLISLALGLVIAMFGAAISIRHQFDKSIRKICMPVGRKSRFLLSILTSQGPQRLLCRLSRAATRFLTDSLSVEKNDLYVPGRARYVVSGDQPRRGMGFNVDDEEDTWLNPQVVVQLPVLKGVSTVNALCQIHNFKGDVLTLKPGRAKGVPPCQLLPTTS